MGIQKISKTAAADEKSENDFKVRVKIELRASKALEEINYKIRQ